MISGASHTGKTALAQRLLEKYKFPYLSEDHMKMGLIRSGNTALTPMSDDESLTRYLWPIVREMIKTAIENRQNMIVEGCYIPFGWKNDFPKEYLSEIRHTVLVMSERYIENHFDDIVNYGNIIEKRLFNDVSKEELIAENGRILLLAQKHENEIVLIDEKYEINIGL